MNRNWLAVVMARIAHDGYQLMPDHPERRLRGEDRNYVIDAESVKAQKILLRWLEAVTKRS